MRPEYAFCIEMSADHALVDSQMSRIHPLPAETLSTFVHEYMHYLQNVSTVSGFAAYHATQQLLALFSVTVDKTGRSAGSVRLRHDEKDRLAQIVTYLDLLEGDEGPEDDELHAVVNVATDRVELPFGKGVCRLSEVMLTCEVENSQGKSRQQVLQLGLCVIEEGLAFEIDRIVAGIDGAAVDLDAAPTFPYRVLRAVGEFLAPGIDRRDLIACGVFALLTNDPAGSLIEELRDFDRRRADGASRVDALAGVEEATREGRIESIKLIISDVEGLKQMHTERGAASNAMDQVGEIFTTLLRRRIDDPLWEVRAFLPPELDQDALNELLATVEPCLVLQRLPDNDKDPQDADRPQHDLMLAFGAPGAATREMTKRAIPVLQCQVHYVNVHLPDETFVASSEATGKGASCPFYRSCTLKLRREHADTCKNKPWEIYERSEEKTCWYGAAVAGTIGTVRLSPESPPPTDVAPK